MLERRLVLGLLLNAACAHEERPAYAVDATLYVESLCEALCEKNRDCERPFYEDADQCRETCRESILLEMSDEDGCFEFQIEYGRCRLTSSLVTKSGTRTTAVNPVRCARTSIRPGRTAPAARSGSMRTSSPTPRLLHHGESISKPLALGLLLLTACYRETLPIQSGPTVDARPYAAGVCALRCFKLEECGALEGSVETCEATCTEEALATLDEDPCWVETIEVRRCVARKMECADIIADEIPDGDDTPCEKWLDFLDACTF